MSNFSLEKARVLVVGDVMLDRYWKGDTDRISPEAPVPVVKVNKELDRVGGAGNVAVNITSLGGEASLIGIVGDDDAGQDLTHLIENQSVKNYCIKDKDSKTTIKLRVLAQNQQLIRLDFEEKVSLDQQQVLQTKFDSLLSEANLLVLSDYGKGVIRHTADFIKKANAAHVKTLIDPKKKSFDDYKGAYLLTPNRKEFEQVVGYCHTQEDIENKARTLIASHDLGGLLITQGADGMSLIMKDEDSVHFSTHAQEVFDVTGAGDTVIATLATAIASGMSVVDSVHLSCVAAGIVVGRIGTSSVTQEDIHLAVNRSNQSNNKLCDEDHLIDILNNAKSKQQKVVMTNGCFDILHSGHVSYLKAAAQLGDILIVAVNSDESVKQLKGESRPINSLKHRMDVLAGLASVDYVIAFNEETPEQLICKLQPNILVKGGDYTVEQIAGRNCVDEVVLMEIVEGQSTTNIVKKIQSSN